MTAMLVCRVVSAPVSVRLQALRKRMVTVLTDMLRVRTVARRVFMRFGAVILTALFRSNLA